MKAYSQDLRLCILHAIDGGQSKAAVARRFAAGLTTVKRYLARRDAEGHVRPRSSPGRPAHIRPRDYATLTAQVQAHPDATLAEHAQLWETSHGVALSPWAMGRVIRKLKLSRKKRP